MLSPRAVIALLTVVSIVTAAPRTITAQMDEPVWKTKFRNAGWMTRLPAGTLLLGNRDSLVAIDQTTGQAMWARTDLGGLNKEYLDPVQKDVLILNVPRTGAPTLRAVDLRDGRDRWSKPGVSLGHWLVPSKQALLVWHWRPGDSVNEKEFGGRMVLIRLEDGQVLWEEPAFFSKWPADRDETGNLWRVQAPLFDSDSTMITFMAGMGIRRWHVGTGKMLWAAELKLTGAMSPYYGYAPMAMDSAAKTVFVPTGLGLASVSLDNGAIAFREKLEGIPRQLQMLPGGLLMRAGSETVAPVRRAASTRTQRFLASAIAANQSAPKPINGDDFLVLLDPASGKKRWGKEFKLHPKSTNFVVRGDKAYIASGDRLFSVVLATGEGEQLAKLPDFKNDDDAPAELVQTDAGLILRGQTNVMFVDYDGKLVHHTSFKRPGRSLFVRAAATGLGAGASHVANAPNDVLGFMVRNGSVSVGDPDELRKRSTQTVHTGTRSVLYAEVKRPGKEDNGFVMLDATTGQTVGDVITAGLLHAAAFSAKDVDLAFDLEAGWMYYLLVTSGNGELGAWRLGANR